MTKYSRAIIVICAALLALWLAACYTPTVITSPVSTPTLTELPRAPLSTPAAFVPIAYRCACEPTPTPTPTPEPVITPTLTIYDCDGGISDTHWLTMTFGDVRWSPPPSDLTELRCSIGPAVIVVHVQDADGEPLQNATVVLHWPDAPMLPLELRQCGLDRGVYGPTNENGDIGFGLGHGSYYWPPAGGPHTLWTVGGKSCLSGIGMIAATDHQTLWPTWVLSAEKVEQVGADWGYSTGAIVSQEEIDGRSMWVIRAP